MLNKPRNVLSSTEDEMEEGRKTVRDLVEVEGHLYPVGRLDKQSLGLILLTNDGDMAHKLTHPRYEHEKVYRVLLEGFPTEQTMNEWRRGVELDGKWTLPVQIRFLRKKDDATWFQIIMREGRKRQIRRIAALLGHPVRTLIRTQLGPLKLGELEQGKWRHLTPGEVASIRRDIRRHGKQKIQFKKKPGVQQRRRKSRY
jgi:pseudouridine synthase